MHYKTVILGAGAAGMMCAAYSGGSTLVLDHAKRAGDKIRISGGGRCNFTNTGTHPSRFLSQNPHFCKSALGRYTAQDFISLVEKHKIAYHEKKLGQLFCDTSAQEIIQLLLDEMAAAGADLQLEAKVASVQKTDTGFALETEQFGKRQTITCNHFVVACGGKSIPKMGATGFGYEIAKQFDHDLTDIRPALVPLTFSEDVLATTNALAGVAADAVVTCGKIAFEEALLFTHRGLSGPSILQISSYWRETQPIRVNLLPETDIFEQLKSERPLKGKKSITSLLTDLLPNSLAQNIANRAGVSGNLADQSDKKLRTLANLINDWELYPIGSEGYRTAEVTLGGVSTARLNSKTMESKHVLGLYFIGEVVDVTGWLGGYNFQWAWSSGYAAGTAIANVN